MRETKSRSVSAEKSADPTQPTLSLDSQAILGSQSQLTVYDDDPNLVLLDDPPPQPAAMSKTLSTVKSVAKTAAKRQRSIRDMFGSAPTPAKRPKTTGTTAGANTSPAASAGPSNSSPTSTLARSDRTAHSRTLNAMPFNLSAFKASLTPEQTSLLALELDPIHGIGLGWLKVLHAELRKPYFLDLKRALWKEGVRGINDSDPKIYPPARNIYTFSRETPLGKVKGVILGQDPYHGFGQAHGLSFSVPPGCPIPGSLRNIYTELQNNYPEFIRPKHGCLLQWAADGVLLLNCSLTVREGKANSHAELGWGKFVDAVIKAVDDWGGANLPGEGKGRGRGVFFMAWGAFAQKRLAHINETRHLVLKSAHPSPLAAHKGFYNMNHFRLANDWLEAKYGPEAKVNWCALPENYPAA